MSSTKVINVVDLILRKRDRGVLSADEVAGFVKGYTLGQIPDYQASALLMASFLNGMNEDEMVALTDAMMHSGEVIDHSEVQGRKVDKHSTGGVGDKTSIILAPLVASCGVPVPMISGRGLGHTGGTLDKLESIPGFSTQMDIGNYKRQLKEIGVVMIGQTAEIAPADKKLYALRDVTGTVEFIPFIAASILSKKLAEGIDNLVLDVKFGSGAFMSNENEARKLAETLTNLAERFGTYTVALLTDMDQPLGFGVGNWPEIVESIACLQGNGPEDVMDVTYALASEMLMAGGAVDSLDEGLSMAENAIESGRAWAKFEQLVERQGGSLDSIRHPSERDQSRSEAFITAPYDGMVTRIDAKKVGRASVSLGAGRKQKDDVVDPIAGISLYVSAGHTVTKGDKLARVQASAMERVEETETYLSSAFEFGEECEIPISRVKDRYSNGTWLNP